MTIVLTPCSRLMNQVIINVWVYSNNWLHISDDAPVLATSAMFMGLLSISGLSGLSALSPGRPSWGWSSPQHATRRLFCYSAPYGSPLFSHSHHETLSAAWVTWWMSLYFFPPSVPHLLKAQGRNLAAKPLQPASVGRHLALHLLTVPH